MDQLFDYSEYLDIAFFQILGGCYHPAKIAVIPEFLLYLLTFNLKIALPENKNWIGNNSCDHHLTKF